MQTFSKLLFGLCAAGLAVVPSGFAQSTNFTVLHSFTGTGGDGAAAYAGLVEGRNGALYGTTYYGGGERDFGTVFRLNRDGSGYAVLHSFQSVSGDGQNPYAGLVEGSDGALYGTTEQGGSARLGTIFKLNEDGSGYTLLHNFQDLKDDGYHPEAGLVEGSDGALYATTSSGGSSGAGTVFRVGRNGSGFTVLHGFSYSDGDWPYGGLVEATGSMLFGTTFYGGTYANGTVFKLNRNGSSFTLLYSFGDADGDPKTPLAGLVEGSDGMLYGTTFSSGSVFPGAVFKLNQDGGNFTVLHKFVTYSDDGESPYAGVVEGSGGALYGTTYVGGSAKCGTVFALNKDGTGYTILHSFTGGFADGRYPYAGLVEGSDGALYGTTKNGGSSNSGTVYRITGPGRPRLRLQSTSTNTVFLSWPSPATGFALEENDTLTTTNWTSISQVPANDGTRKSVIIPVSSGARFYRLKAAQDQ
jgi:uncharacterized repeat protein (TIGR03803 family)